jgi:hypothetical protein
MANAHHTTLLAAYPSVGMLPIDPTDPESVEEVVDNDAIGDTLFAFLWRELDDVGNVDPADALRALESAIADIQTVKSAIVAKAGLTAPLYTVGLHHHQHGVSTYLFRSAVGRSMSRAEFIDCLDEEFEADRDESVEIISFDEREILDLDKE